MDKDYNSLVLAGLLHDIGKFLQRASKNPMVKKHQEFGAEWLKAQGFLEDICEIAKRHHWLKERDSKKKELCATTAPESLRNITQIVAEADNLSAGERPEKIVDEREERVIFEQKTPMVSVFSKVSLSRKRGYNNCWGSHLLRAMSNSAVYPELLSTKGEWEEIPKSDYEERWREFEEEFESKVKDSQYLIDNLLLLLEKHTSFIPSETQIVKDREGRERPDPHPDVSLFDHLKTTAAIASCLYLHFIEEDGKGVLNRTKMRYLRTKMRYLLVGGDITGIQRFIYTISSKGTLKTLRGRSFFVEMLAELFVYKILKNAGLSRANLIFNGGGRFYLLLPNTERIKKELNRIRADMNEYLLQEHSGRLSLVLEWVPFCGNAFITVPKWKHKCSNKNGEICKRCSKKKNRPTISISDVWEELEERIYEGKRHKFRDQLFDLYQKELPEPEHSTCKVCHKDVEEAQLVLLREDEEERVEVCPFCKYLFELGGRLPKERCLSLMKEVAMDKTQDNPEVALMINDWDLGSYREKEAYPSFLANYPLEDSDVPREFNELAERSMGIKRVGVLRMDVDDLGEIIFRGFKESEKTFSRLSSFSRQLSYFFKLYLNEICNGNTPNERLNLMKKSKEYRNVVIIYSGGDDLFLVGAWDDVVELSFDIRNSFKKYTCNNPDINISSGLTVLPNKFPLYQMAELTKEALDQAKLKKDSINLFYSPGIACRKREPICLRWEEAQKEVLSSAKGIIDDFGIRRNDYLDLKLPRAFIYNLLRIIDLKREEGILYLPLLAYTLAMTEENLRISRKKGWEEGWMRIKDNLMHMEKIDIFYPVLVWIDLLSRKEGV